MEEERQPLSGQPGSGDELEEFILALLQALCSEFPNRVVVEYQAKLALQSGDGVVPDFSLKVVLPHEESHYMIECQHRKKTSAALLHKIQHVRSKSSSKTFIFVYGSKITSARRRAFESEGVMVYSSSEFAHAFVAYLRETLSAVDKASAERESAALTDLLKSIPHHQHGDYSPRHRRIRTETTDENRRGHPGNSTAQQQ